MNKIGFIGYGSMGKMLVNGFLSSGVLLPNETVVSSRTLAKMDNLVEQWDGTILTSDNRKAARESEVLFLCVKPLDVFPVLQEIKSDLSEQTHVVSIAACVTIGDIESYFSGQISKVIPSLTSEVKEGISLVCHNGKVITENSKRLETMLNAISQVICIKEADFDVASDLTSCAPGLIAAIFDNLVRASVRQSTIAADVARQMVVQTLLGTARLLAEKGLSFSGMIERVATKGGITEEGVKVLNEYLPLTFDELFTTTLSKHAVVRAMIAKQWSAGQ